MNVYFVHWKTQVINGCNSEGHFSFKTTKSGLKAIDEAHKRAIIQKDMMRSGAGDVILTCLSKV